MTMEEFNEKYANHIEDGHYGLALHNEKIVDMLDGIFQVLTLDPDFTFSQIKVKFGHSRIYSNADDEINRSIERLIDRAYVAIETYS